MSISAKDLINGIQYFTRRGVLSSVDVDFNRSYHELPFALECKNSTVKRCKKWIKLTQIGFCKEFSCHQYYTIIQKILLSCYKPDELQVIFLVHGDGEKVSFYIGLRKLKSGSGYSFKGNLDAFLNALLPGTKSLYINDSDIEKISDEIRNSNVYKKLYSFTGLPSFSGKDGEESISAIDTLIGPLSKRKFLYYVVADPIDETKISSMMTTCMEMASKVESAKTINISESQSQSSTVGMTESSTYSVNEANSRSISKKGEDNHLAAQYMSFMGLGDFINQSTETVSRATSKGISQSNNNSETHGISSTISKTIINKFAEYAAKQLNKHTERYEQGLGLGMWKTGVYLLVSEDDGMFTSQSAAMQLKAVVSGKDTSLEPIRIHDLSCILGRNEPETSEYRAKTSIVDFCIPDFYFKSINSDVVVKNNFNSYNMNLTTYLNTEELSCFINLPQRSVPGVSVVEYSADFSLTPQTIKNENDAIQVGRLVYGGSQSNINVKLPLNTLSRHALVVGVNGSGKTNTVLSVLEGFMQRECPFLVIEPVKTEYVDWAIKYNKKVTNSNKKIKIFIPGCDRYSKIGFVPDKLRLNPFEVINLGNGEPRVVSHIDRLKSVFAAAFPMQDILPVVVEHLLYELYTEVCPMLDKSDPRYLKKWYPTLSSINREFINTLMRNIGYGQEVTQNISAALKARFNSLKCGWKGELLNNQSLTGMTWEELFNSPCIINLSYAGDDQDRAFIMSLLLQFLYEYRISEAESFEHSFDDNKCRHLVVVEEAHRVMLKCTNQESPQYKSGMMFSNFLSEVRAYGQGMMIVDQVPTRLIEDAIKNTNIKIIHKLVASDDSKIIAECIGLSDRQQKIIAKLSVGQAVLAGFNSANVMSSDCSDIYLAQVDKKK